jgi:hypothetical protein
MVPTRPADDTSTKSSPNNDNNIMNANKTNDNQLTYIALPAENGSKVISTNSIDTTLATSTNNTSSASSSLASSTTLSKSANVGSLTYVALPVESGAISGVPTALLPSKPAPIAPASDKLSSSSSTPLTTIASTTTTPTVDNQYNQLPINDAARLRYVALPPEAKALPAKPRRGVLPKPNRRAFVVVVVVIVFNTVVINDLYVR